MRIEWFHRPFLMSGLIALVASLTAVFSLILGGVLLVCLGLLVCFAPGARRSVFGIVFACFAVFFVGAFWRHTVAMRPSKNLVGQTDTLTGVVVHCPDSGRMYTVQVTESTHLPAGTRVLLFCPDVVAPQMYERVTANVKWQALHEDRQSMYWADGVFLMAYPTGYGEQSVVYTTTEENSVRHTLFAWRENLANRLWRILPGQDGAVLAGLCLGVDNRLTDATYASFRNSGLPHLLVVSGLHVTVFATALFWVSRFLRLGRRLGVVLSMAGVVFFCLLVGLSPSVVRAGTACVLMLAGQLFRRRPDSLNSMGFALTVLLACNPYAVLDVGLQLSFSAAAGVVLLSPRLLETLTAHCPEEETGYRYFLFFLWKKAAAALSVSLGASVFLTPLLCLLFGRLSLYTLFANLLTVMVAGWLLVLGFVMLCIPNISIFQVLQHVAVRLATVGCRWLRGIAQLLGGDNSTVYAGRLWQMVFLCGACVLVGVLLLADKRVLFRRVLCCLGYLLLLACCVSRSMSAGALTVQVIPYDGTAALLLSKHGQYALLLPDGDGLQTVNYAIRDSACDELDFVLLAQGQTTDAGTLKTVLDTAPTERVLSHTADWSVGCPYTVETIRTDSRLSFWTDCALICSSAGWWRLEIGTSSLVFVFESAQTCPAAGCVLACDGALTAWPEAAQCVVISADKTAESVSLLPTKEQPTTVVAGRPCYLSTRGNGEWSVTRWE